MRIGIISKFLRKCKCGCKRTTNWDRRNKKYNDYIKGHAWLGRKHSVITKKKIGVANGGSNSF